MNERIVICLRGPLAAHAFPTIVSGSPTFRIVDVEEDIEAIQSVIPQAKVTGVGTLSPGITVSRVQSGKVIGAVLTLDPQAIQEFLERPVEKGVG